MLYETHEWMEPATFIETLDFDDEPPQEREREKSKNEAYKKMWKIEDEARSVRNRLNRT